MHLWIVKDWGELSLFDSPCAFKKPQKRENIDDQSIAYEETGFHAL